MKDRTKIAIFVLALALNQAWAKDGQYSPYIIKKGQTISQILSDHNLAPLYGESEWVEKVLLLNRLTYETAKKIEPGEVVILPVPPHYFKKEDLAPGTPIVNVMTSQTVGIKMVSTARPKLPRNSRHQVRAHLGINRISEGLTETVDTSAEQNVLVGANYRFKHRESSRGVRQSEVDLGLNTRGHSEIASLPGVTITYKPSYWATYRYRHGLRYSGVEVTGETQLEQASATDLNQSNTIVVRRDMTLYAGLGIEKHFSILDRPAYTRANYMRSLRNFNSGGLGVREDLQVHKYQLTLGGHFSKKSYFEVFGQYRDIESSVETEAVQYGLLLGRRFY